MGHGSYARTGNVIYRFNSKLSRDAWVAAAGRHEAREAVAGSTLPLRLRTGRHVPGLELREGPELPPAPATPAKPPPRRKGSGRR